MRATDSGSAGCAPCAGGRSSTIEIGALYPSVLGGKGGRCHIGLPYAERARRTKISDTARYLVARAIKHGDLVRGVCARCGTDRNVQGHHEDYSRPLDVIWLCPLHHTARHKECAPVYPPPGVSIRRPRA